MTVFDRIIAGSLPASFVHQDEHCVSLMDIGELTRGHVLLVSRRSVATLAELEPGIRAHLWEVAHRIARAQQQGLGSRAQHFVLNDGRAASQSVPHVHLHVIPRYGGDGVRTLVRLAWHIATIQRPPRETPALRQRLDAAALAIRNVFSD